MSSEVENSLLDFISEHFRIPKDRIDRDTSLVDQGVIDSFGFIEIITFLEAEFSISVPDDQINRDNFGSVSRIVTFVKTASEKALQTNAPAR